MLSVSGRSVLATLVILTVVFGLGGYLARRHFGEIVRSVPGSCRVQGDTRVRLDAEQMSNAATIAAVGIRRKVDDRAIIVALAVALQESKLRNLRHLGNDNDHDSLGLFQQRPSQGWGTPAQIMDQRYATDRFYTALTRVKGWERMRVTEAGQRVQRSAYPEAYEKWADDAHTLAAAFTGKAQGALTCDTRAEPVREGEAAVKATGELLRLDFGRVAPKVVTEKHHLRVPVRDARTGWQFAHWLVAQSETTGVAKVSFGDRQWSVDKGEWAPATTARAAGEVVAEVVTVS